MSADPYVLKLVPDSTESTVSIKSTLIHQCPFVPETDVGTVALSWQCREMTVELHSLAAYLATWHDQSISSEEITAQIRTDLEQLDGIEVLSVETTWHTAGMTAHVSA